MNIFALSQYIIECARQHVDKHVVKMILEYAQLLSTCHRVLDPDTSKDIYRKTHTNHPCAVWVRQSTGNYNWLYNLWLELIKEYKYRYHRKKHASERLVKLLKTPPVQLEEGPMTPFPQVVPEEYQCEDPVLAYRKYYYCDKQHLAKWTNRDKPDWFITGNKHL